MTQLWYSLTSCFRTEEKEKNEEDEVIEELLEMVRTQEKLYRRQEKARKREKLKQDKRAIAEMKIHLTKIEKQLEKGNNDEYDPNTWLLRMNSKMLRLKIEEKKLAIKMVSKRVKSSLVNPGEMRIMNMEACSEYKNRRLKNYYKEEEEDHQFLKDYYESELVMVAAQLDFRRMQDQETFKKLDYNQEEFKTRSLPCLNEKKTTLRRHSV